jgi:DNA-nicking Smr family endonuclease
MGLLDFLFSIVKAICGESSQPEGEKPTAVQRPPRPQEPLSPLPGGWPTPQHDRLRYQDQNQGNQQNEHYTSLRAKANQEGDAMAKCFQQSHEAYSRREGALAKELSEKGKKHERTMEALNAEASAWIFRENNSDSKPGELDLHGLYVKEAISYSDKAIKEARQRGDSQIRLIVGKGLHSNGHVAKIKPALEDLMKQLNLPVEVDPQNTGVLIVQLA